MHKCPRTSAATEFARRRAMSAEMMTGPDSELASGNAAQDLDRLERSDELGAIVRGLRVFQDNQRRLASLNEAQQARAVAQAQRAQHAASS